LIENKIFAFSEFFLWAHLVVPCDYFKGPTQNTICLIYLLNGNFDTYKIWNTINLAHTSTQTMEKSDFNRLHSLSRQCPTKKYNKCNEANKTSLSHDTILSRHTRFFKNVA